MATLDRAIEIAALAHAGQSDKAGSPYIAHPMRLMVRFVREGNEKCAIIAALHDVVEDSDWTLEGLGAEGFTDEIVEAVGALTRGEDEEYLAYVARAAKHPLGRWVKQADLMDNLNEDRLEKAPEADRSRLRRKYAEALQLLSKTP
jgi:(p)ppGpp synthase/HD superfamily hydrolase